MYAKIREYGEAPQPIGNEYRCEKCGKSTTWLKALQQCPNCGRWVCESDWDKNVGSCSLCSAGITAKFAEAEKLKQEVEGLQKLVTLKEEELTKARSKITTPFSRANPILGSRVYVSYAVGSELEKLVEFKVKRLLETLGMTVSTSKKDPSVPQDPSVVVKNADIIVALLTKDVKHEEQGKVAWSPTHYVLDDVKNAAGRKAILLVEQGVEYPAEIRKGALVVELERDDPAELVLTLTSAIMRLEVTAPVKT